MRLVTVSVLIGALVGCGRSSHTAVADAGETPAPIAEARWLAVANSKELLLVGFDQPEKPRLMALEARGDAYVAAAFTADGSELVYALGGLDGFGVTKVSVPAGERVLEPIPLPGGSPPELIPLGRRRVVAKRPAGEHSQLVDFDAQVASDAGPLAEAQVSSDASTLVARSDKHVFLATADAEAAMSGSIEGSFSAFVAGDGEAIAVVSDQPVPELGLPISVTRATWTPPDAPCTPAPCASAFTLGQAAWPAAASPIVLELRPVVAGSGSPLMQLSSAEAGPTTTFPARAEGYPVSSRNWGLLSSGDTFLVANDAGTAPWRVLVGPGVPSEAALAGPVGFAQYAVASGDERALFVVSFTKPTVSVFALDLPLTATSAPRLLFKSEIGVGVIAPQPGGPGIVIGTGSSAPIRPRCTLTEDTACASATYYLSDGTAQATRLPSGFFGPEWTPDGEGLVGYLNENVVYVRAQAPNAPLTLSKGSSFYLPSAW